MRNAEVSQKFVEARIPPQTPPPADESKQGWDRRNMQSEQVATTEAQCVVTAEELGGTPRNRGYTRNAQRTKHYTTPFAHVPPPPQNQFL